MQLRANERVLAGFLTTFTMLARDRLSLNEMSWILIKVVFGSSYLGFDVAVKVSAVILPSSLSPVLGRLTGSCGRPREIAPEANPVWQWRSRAADLAHLRLHLDVSVPLPCASPFSHVARRTDSVPYDHRAR